jgi:hypothetical protein
MACGMYVWASLMDRGVNYETSCVDKSFGATNTVAILIHLNHIRDGEESEVHTIRIDPKRVWLYGVYTRLVRIDTPWRRKMHLGH